MSSTPLRPPIRGFDSCGAPVVRVPLANVSAHATIDAADYDALIARGISPNWSLHANTVLVAKGKGNCQRVARLIMDPPSGDLHVRHHDKNALDLRRGNLFLKQINRQPKPSVTGRNHPI